MGKQEKSPYVSIASTVGGIMLATIACVLIFAQGSSGALHSVVWGFVALGSVVSLFVYLDSRKNICCEGKKEEKKKPKKKK